MANERLSDYITGPVVVSLSRGGPIQEQPYPYTYMHTKYMKFIPCGALKYPISRMQPKSTNNLINTKRRPNGDEPELRCSSQKILKKGTDRFTTLSK
jgi:hypothetical protein